MSKRMTESDWLEVAAVYLAATKKPTLAVANHFGVNHSTAAKRVQRARERGLIPSTRKGSARTRGQGLHVPVQFRDSDERKVQLCDTCLVPWPCPHVELDSTVRVTGPVTAGAGTVRLYVDGETLLAKVPGREAVRVTTVG